MLLYLNVVLNPLAWMDKVHLRLSLASIAKTRTCVGDVSWHFQSTPQEWLRPSLDSSRGIELTNFRVSIRNSKPLGHTLTGGKQIRACLNVNSPATCDAHWTGNPVDVSFGCDRHKVKSTKSDLLASTNRTWTRHTQFRETLRVHSPYIHAPKVKEAMHAFYT
ncbi:hypothetical protein EG68_02185 [Paragonimus skrjabini miyazakii]|uniref:Uncharacterized protein n=1 Tax=Paragonimus skrjabini miyazakii TaxID=59628 RepID=A0A8S9Z4H1_9TREM|nr:hypothetical protein EG68_02185 [Paragonimus skrjabini miyazakii]